MDIDRIETNNWGSVEVARLTSCPDLDIVKSGLTSRTAAFCDSTILVAQMQI
jgi:hypothetical protein